MLGPLKRAYYTYACTHTHTHARGRKRDGSGNDFPVAFSFRFVLKGTGRKIEIPRYHRGIYIHTGMFETYIRLGRYFTRVFFSFPPPLLPFSETGD